MSNWTTKKLSEIVLFNPRETIKKGILAKKIAMDTLVPFCRDIPSFELTEFNGGTKFRNGDTIMARITPCLENGKTAKINILGDNEVGFGSTEYIVFRAIEGLSNEDYVYYLVCSPIVRDPAIKSMVGSSGRQRVQTDVLKNLEICVPDLETQVKIGLILKSIDDKITINKKINENLEQQAQAVFKSWFVDFEPFGGVMPDDWYVSTLGKVSDMSAGGDKPNNATQTVTAENTIPIYSNGIASEGLYGFTDIAKIQDESVTVSARGTIGYVCLRQTPYFPIVRLVTLVPKKNLISAKYLYHWLKLLHIVGTGTTQQQLTVPSFKKTEIIIPAYSIMERFTKTVNPLYECVLANKSENQHLDSLRDTLLPKLMSGEIDVSEVQV